MKDLCSLETIERLIAFDTTSRNSNRKLIDFACDRLAKQGARIRITEDPARAKANLFATVGSGDRPGLLLSAHTDTVPVDGQVCEW